MTCLAELVWKNDTLLSMTSQYAVSTKTIYIWLRQDTGEGVILVLQYEKLKRENKEFYGMGK